MQGSMSHRTHEEGTQAIVVNLPGVAGKAVVEFD